MILGNIAARVTHVSRRRGCIAAACLAIAFAHAIVGQAADSPPDRAADSIVWHGRIYTGQTEQPWVEAIAVRDGKIIATGSEIVVGALAGPSTRFMDLKGQMAMPGLVDVHVHLLTAARDLALYTCEFSQYDGLDEILAAVRRCAARGAPDDWIIGGSFGSQLIERVMAEGALAELDRASAGRPVYLRDDSTHNRWVNTRAMEIAGINATTPNPAAGAIGRYKDNGRLNGVFIERSAYAMIEKVIPQFKPYDLKQKMQALRQGLRKLNAMGVTAFQDGRIDEAELAEAYLSLDRSGELTAHVGLSLLASPTSESNTDPLEEFRTRSVSPQLSFKFAKIYLDGVMMTRTAQFLEPYLPVEGEDPCFRGGVSVSNGKLVPLILKLDREGVAIKFHATGDGSVRQALDAIEVARRVNGATGPIHQIAHAGYVAESDVVRFKDLNVAAELSPTVWYPGPVLEATIKVIGEARARHYWPVKDMQARGILLAGGTDWKTLPGEFSDLWSGIEGLVTRRNPTGRVPGSLWPEQAVDIGTALRIYTVNSARAMSMETLAGTLEVGKSADFIVLDRDPMSIPAEQISETRVVRTVFEGRTVYERASEPARN